jgi:hypothetical protein
MKDIRSLLDEADPVRREPELSEADATRMRSVIVSAARQPGRPSPFWSGALALAAAAVLTVVAGMLGERSLPTGRVSSQIEPAIAPAAIGERRQVQFSTPGGTRIIWTLDPEFQPPEVRP